MSWKIHQTEGWQQQIVNAAYKTAAWPGDWVPYLPVGDCPAISRVWAEMLGGHVCRQQSR
jgi:hypothetical protein